MLPNILNQHYCPCINCYETGLGKIPHKAGKHVFMYKLEHVYIVPVSLCHSMFLHCFGLRFAHVYIGTPCTNDRLFYL